MQSVDTIAYFGSFNPVHKGHIAIAEYVLSQGLCNDVMLIVSPLNPFKQAGDMAPRHDRLKMARIAAAGSRYPDQISASDIEFGLPVPSRTVRTLEQLSSLYPGRSFGLLMGGDNVDRFDKWLGFESILDNYPIYVYPREGCPDNGKWYSGKLNYLTDAPLWPFSATAFRKSTAGVAEHLPDGVAEYIKEHGLYGK